MTSIRLVLTGAMAKAEVTGLITAGMVGIPVTIEYDDQWEGLIKSFVCRSDAGIKTVLDVDTQATVVPEVLQWIKNASNELFIGVEGRDADGAVIFPSTMAYCGKIVPSANPELDPAIKNAEPVWSRVLKTVKGLEKVEDRWRNDLATIIREVINQKQIIGGFYSPEVVQVDAQTIKLTFSPSREDMPLISDITVILPEGKEGPRGIRGEKGDAPVCGVDYWTEADKQQINEDSLGFIVDELAKRAQQKPGFANSAEECTDATKLYVLPDGYLYTHTTSKKEVFTDVLKDVGHTKNMRINSSGGIVAWTNTPANVTGYISVKAGDVIRLKNMTVPNGFGESGNYSNSVGSYDENKTFIGKVGLFYRGDNSHEPLERVLEGDNVIQFTVAPSLFGENVAYIVINAAKIDENSEVYVNSTIQEMDEWKNTGHAFVPADYEGRIISLEAKATNHDAILSQIEGGVDGSAVPDYWRKELQTKADLIQQAMETAGQNRSAFLWYTDAHWPSNSKMSPAILKYLRKNTPMNKVNFGGDIVGDPLTFTHENIKYVYDWRERISDLPDHHSVYGNHDLNHCVTDVRNMAHAFILAAEQTTDMVVGGDGYYYIDHPTEKTRYLYLSYMVNDQAAMLAQGKFIVDAISGVAEGWHIVAISHRWFQYTSASAPKDGAVPAFEADILSVFDAYNARKRRAASNYFLEQDFTEGKGKVEFCIGGHIHVDYDFETDGGIPVIITAADANQERGSDQTTDSDILGTVNESAVFGIVADYNSRIITVVGVGRGTSREIAY